MPARDHRQDETWSRRDLGMAGAAFLLYLFIPGTGIKNAADPVTSTRYLELTGYGSDSNTPDWGAKWNRINTASIWDASAGDAIDGDVLSGKKYYAGANRTLKTGTLVPGVAADFTNLAYSFRDDYAGPTNSYPPEDYQGEEAIWTNTNSAAVPDKVWKDERTGLYWSSTISTSMSNSFTMATCPYFSITPPTSLSTYDGLTSSCGNAINACATSTVGGRSNWYLPSQKELMQAYIDGMYNKAGTTLANAAAFTTTGYYWSSSEVSNGSTYAWDVYLGRGYTRDSSKAETNSVRCVSRD